jgi:hypothetical protein
VAFEREGISPAVPVAAPVLQGARYGGLPIYFSDVIVHADSGISSFSELRGRTWAYNEPLSQSGYGVTRYHLLSIGETGGFFGEVIEAGFRDLIRMVATAKPTPPPSFPGAGYRDERPLIVKSPGSSNRWGHRRSIVAVSATGAGSAVGARCLIDLHGRPAARHCVRACRAIRRGRPGSLATYCSPSMRGRLLHGIR